MQWFSKRRSCILHYGASHLTQDYLENPSAKVLTDLATSGIELADLKHYKLLIDFRCEGQCDKSAVKLIEFCQNLPVKDFMVVFNTVVDTANLRYKAASCPTYLCNFMGWFDRLKTESLINDIDTKFLCLLRRASPSRAKLAHGILDIDSKRLSFGSMHRSSDLSPYQSFFPGQHLPMLLDGPTLRDENNLEHDQSNIIFRQCLFNIVAESSAQTDPGVWRSFFISEKTFKAFGLRHIPIWFSVPGFVAKVRTLGFDMFDDIVNHSYDQIQDEDDRLQAILHQIHELNNLSMAQCSHLKKSLIKRFDANFALLDHYAQHNVLWYNQLEQNYNDN